MSIRSRIIGIVALLSFLAAATVAVGAYRQASLLVQMEAQYRESTLALQEFALAMEAYQKYRVDLRDLVTNRVHVETLLQTIEGRKALVLGNLRSFAMTVPDPETKRAAAALEVLVKTYFEKDGLIEAQFRASGLEAARAVIYRDRSGLSSQVSKGFSAVFQRQTNAAKARVERNRSEETWLLVALSTVTLGIVAGTFGLGWSLARGLGSVLGAAEGLALRVVATKPETGETQGYEAEGPPASRRLTTSENPTSNTP